MFILKKGHQPGVYVPLRALFLVLLVIQVSASQVKINFWTQVIKTWNCE